MADWNARYTNAICDLVTVLCNGDKKAIDRTWENIRNVTKAVPTCSAKQGEMTMEKGTVQNDNEETQEMRALRDRLMTMMGQCEELWSKAEKAADRNPAEALSIIATVRNLTVQYIALLPPGWESAKENAEWCVAEADKQIASISARLPQC